MKLMVRDGSKTMEVQVNSASAFARRVKVFKKVHIGRDFE